MCGLTRSASPAAAAARFTAAHACCRASRRPAIADEQRAAADAARRGAGASIAARGPSIQRSSQSSATSPIGTSRSLSPLPMTRTNAAVHREVLEVEPERLADPQPGGVEQLEQRPVAQAERVRRLVRPRRRRPRAGRSVSATVSVSGRQPRLARQVEVGRHVDRDQALAVREPVEALERGGAAAQAGRREARIARRPRRARAAR